MTATRPNATEAARAIIQHPDVQLVAIDLRGTLLHTPRVTALLPELASQSVPDHLAQSAQARFDEQLRGPLQKRGDILDWTRFAAASMASTLAAEWHPALDVEAVVARFRNRYLSEAQRLVEAESMRRAANALPARCVVIADGPLERESAVLTSCFGGAWSPPLVSSECLGVNKLTSEFFVRLGERWRVPPASTVVIGDRWDKDVAIPERAGCRGVLVGSGGQRGIAALSSLTDLALLLEGRVLACAA